MAELAMGVPAQPGIVLPEYEERRTVAGSTTGKDTKTETLSAEQLAAEARQEQALGAQKQAIADKAKFAGDVARAEVEGVGREQAAADWAEAQATGPAAQKATDYVTWARQHTKDESDVLAKRPSPALFADREGWDNVRLAVGMALAGIGDAVGARAAVMAGHAPSNESTVKSIIDHDINRQRMAIEKLKDNVAIARTGLSDAVEAKRALLADVNLRAAEMYKRAALLTKARMAALKIDQATIDQTKEVSDLERARADEHAEYVKGHSTTVNNRWDSAKTTTETVNRDAAAAKGGGGVEAQKNAANFAVIREHGAWMADRMKGLPASDIEAINRVIGAESWREKWPGVAGALTQVGLDPEKGASSTAKEYIDRLHRYEEALGRLQSGGAIGEKEGMRFQDSARPRVSDSEENRAMRAKNLMTDIDLRGQYLEKNAPAPKAPAAEGAPAEKAPAAPAAKKKATLEDRLAEARRALASPDADAEDKATARALLKANLKENRGKR